MKKTYKQNLDNMKLSSCHKYAQPQKKTKLIHQIRFGKMCKYLMIAYGQFDLVKIFDNGLKDDKKKFNKGLK